MMKNRKKSPAKSRQHKSTKLSLPPMPDFNRQALQKSLKIDAKAIGIPAGAADVFIAKTLDAVEKDLKHHRIITESGLKSAIVRELKKFHKDFAYIYQNRDKII